MLCIMYFTIVFINIKTCIIKDYIVILVKKSIFYKYLFGNYTKIIYIYKTLYIKIYII